MISVIIRCGDDSRVFDCINSIKKSILNDSLEIIVSLTPNLQIQNQLNQININYCIATRFNIAASANIGIGKCFGDKIIITDSDTIFEPTTVQLLSDALNIYEIVKPKIIFKSIQGSILSKLVSNLRSVFNDSEKMYTPGVSFRREIISKIGNYYFDESVPWSEDSEFSDRVIQSGLNSSYIRNALIYHPHIGVKHDLAGAILIGAYKKNLYRRNNLKKRLLFYKKLYQNYGIGTLLYGFIWYLLFDVGRYTRYTGFLGQSFLSVIWKYIGRKKQ